MTPEPAGSAALRVLVVDDEPAARSYLRALLREDPDIAEVTECGNGRDAARAIVASRPDLVLLDIEMPERDGFEVVHDVGVERMPVTVFVTAHDEHALRAFRVHALDYLLKPVDRERLAQTVERAKRQLRAGRDDDVADRLRALLDEHAAERAARGTAPGESDADPSRLALKVEGRIIFVDVAAIDWVEASDDHARLHIGKQTVQVRDTLTRLENRLPASRFLRIHRSTIVNLARVREVQPWFQNDFVVILADGTRLTTGRSYRARLQEYLRRAL